MTDKLFRIGLECEHTVYTTVVLELVFADDMHYIFCPECEDHVPTAWKIVTSVTEADSDSLRDVRQWVNFVMPNRIMRIHNRRFKHKGQPFPYKHNRTQRVEFK
jgi:hypothetical protein